jgi:hypothetical protein
MTTTTAQNYAVYLTAATATQAAGTVVNNVVWDGSAAWQPPAGCAAVADPDRAYAVGSIYTVPVASTTYTLSGAATATAGTVMPLTLAPNGTGPTTAVAVTLSDGGAGGTFTPTSVTLPASSTAAVTAAYTPKSAGSVTVTASSDGALIDPAPLALTVSAAA